MAEKQISESDVILEEIVTSPYKYGFKTNIETEEFKARVVLIYKKGDTNKFENYRPISLRNTLYKVFATILQKRIAEKLDK